MTIPVIIALIAGISLGVTVVVLLIRGSFQLGKLVNKVDNQETSIARLNGQIETLTAAFHDLRAEIQQTNQILVGLANHTHDADGRTVFTIPS